MKKYPFRIIVTDYNKDNEPLEIMDCLNYKQVKRALRIITDIHEFDDVEVEVFALVNYEYTTLKRYGMYMCCCETNQSLLGKAKSIRYNIFTTSKDKALKKAFELFKMTKHCNPTCISIELE